jgi:hypothetical protein
MAGPQTEPVQSIQPNLLRAKLAKGFPSNRQSIEEGSHPGYPVGSEWIMELTSTGRPLRKA